MPQLIESTDVVEVVNLPVLIYGGPGMGKTTLGQTADAPLTLDFDKGIHRCRNRKVALRFSGYEETIREAGPNGVYRYPNGHKLAGQPIPYNTIVVDTGGRFLDSIVPVVVAENTKNGYSGNLTPQGWGVLGSKFQQWLRQVLQWGKDVVIIAHEDEGSSANGADFYKPALAGKMAWKEVHQNFDVIGRMYYEGNQKYIDFRPSDVQRAKDGGVLGRVAVPDLHEQGEFLAQLIRQAKANIGKTAAASAAIAQAVEKWTAFLATGPALDTLNKALPELADFDGAAKKQAWTLIQRFAEKKGWAYDKPNRCFLQPAAPLGDAAEPQDDTEPPEGVAEAERADAAEPESVEQPAEPEPSKKPRKAKKADSRESAEQGATA